MKKINSTKFFLFGFIALIIIRLFLNAYIPLMDKTEARYGEIARIMAETGNWITPQIDYGVPFWAKPPLSTWFSAISLKIFGVNEFAVRLPALLLSLIIIFVLKYFVKDKKSFYLTAFVVLTIPEFLLHAGVVSTDTALSFCVAMIFLSFWKLVNNNKPSLWGYLLFAFVGFGLLAKGPIILILTMPPIFIWIFFFREYKAVFKNTPWILGILLALIISVPWYLLAEQKTNGFLEYFIVGEHFKRFFDASWTGDKYGFPKNQPLGIIWAFLLAFAFPWIEILIGKLWKQKKQILENKWVVFLLLWLLWTPLFFTVSKSLIHTYTLPVMVPIALLIEHYWEQIKNKKTAIVVSLIFPIFIVIAIPLTFIDNNLENYSKTDKYILEKLDTSVASLFYYGTKSYSSQFYSKGKIKNISAQLFEDKITNKEAFQIIIPNSYLNEIDNNMMYKLQVLSSNKSNKLYLYQPNI